MYGVYVTQHGANLITCDVESCNTQVAFPQEKLHDGAIRGDEAVRWALSQGWTQVAPSYDVCPFHSEEG
jgi:hypothetical protein